MSTIAPEPPNTTKNWLAKFRLTSQVVVFLLLLSSVIIYVAGWGFSESENGSKWVALLFSLPVAAQIVGCLVHIVRTREAGEKHRTFYHFSMTFSTISVIAYCALWLCYSLGHKSSSRLSLVALVIIAALIAMVGYMMCAFLQVPDSQRWPHLTKLRDGATAEPLWAMSFLFFVIFLDVTFLFGFAFAFHDQYCLSMNPTAPVPALRMVNLDSPDDAKLASQPDAGSQKRDPAASGAAVGPTGQAVAAAKPAGGKDEYYFFFDSTQARLDRGNFEEELRRAAEAGTQSETATPEDVRQIEQKVRENISGKCELKSEDYSPLKRADWVVRADWVMNDYKLFNLCNLEQFRKRLEHESGGGKHMRVVLVGRADDRPMGESKPSRLNDDLQRYKSNYELSEARVQNIRYEIVEALKKQDNTEAWHNLEWLSLPASNEVSEPYKTRADTATNSPAEKDMDRFVDSQQGMAADRKKQVKEMNKRVVIASIVSIPDDITSLQMRQLSRSQFKELNLMDYMYFSIYTITTTGYGDIIPTTSYSKFAISVENICEVLFLVVFFNALVSIRKERDNDLVSVKKDRVEASGEKEGRAGHNVRQNDRAASNGENRKRDERGASGDGRARQSESVGNMDEDAPLDFSQQ